MLGWCLRIRSAVPPHGVGGCCTVPGGVSHRGSLCFRLPHPPARSVSTEASRAGGSSAPNSSGAAEAVVLTPAEKEEISRMSEDPDLYQNIVRSLAPTVYGHDEVKRGVLLMLLGGVQKETHEGIRCAGPRPCSSTVCVPCVCARRQLRTPRVVVSCDSCVLCALMGCVMALYVWAAYSWAV